MLYNTPLAACPRLIERMVEFVYRDTEVFGLNRVHYRDVVRMATQEFNLQLVKSAFWPDVMDKPVPYHTAKNIGDMYGHGDILFTGVELWLAKPTT